MTDTAPDRASLTIFTTSWCGPCARLKVRLAEAAIDFVDVDIESDAGAARLLSSINGGHLTVPTVMFSDSSSLTNPSVEDVRERLASLAAAESAPAS